MAASGGSNPNKLKAIKRMRLLSLISFPLRVLRPLKSLKRDLLNLGQFAIARGDFLLISVAHELDHPDEFSVHGPAVSGSLFLHPFL